MDEDDDIYNTAKSNGNSSPQSQPQKTICIVTRDTGLLEVCIQSDSEISVKTWRKNVTPQSLTEKCLLEWIFYTWFKIYEKNLKWQPQ